MCGIVAIFQRNGQEVDATLLESMTATLQHRGPDGGGSWRAPGVGLGHRRLSIIDLEGGAQPLEGRDASVCIAFNGELYNYEALRRRLPGPWRTHSDTEVFLRLYEEGGLAALSEAVGMWGAAIWDGRSRELIVIRDRLGIKPLYYAGLEGGGWAFASEMRALHRHPQVRGGLDLQAIDALLTYRYIPAPRTAIAAIRKLPPATAAVVSDHGMRTVTYWNNVPRPRRRRDAEAREEYLAAFDASVTARLTADVPVGVFLSGGIDSAAVLQACGRRGMDTFTIGFEGAGADDEIPLARDTAAHFGAQHHPKVMGPADVVGLLDRYAAQIEEPVLNDSAMAIWYLAQLARSRLKVVLSGQGADEPLAGYRRYQGELLGGWLSRVPGLDGVFRRLAPWAPNEMLRRGFESLAVADSVQRSARVYAVFQPHEKESLLSPRMLEASRDHDVTAPIRALHEQCPHLSPLERMLYTDTRMWLVDDLLLITDKLSMAHGLEVRVPFLDHRLVELIESMPLDQKLRVGRRGVVTKYVHRTAVEQRLPAEIIQRKKRGFNNPMDRWLRRELAADVSSRLLGESPLHALVRREAIARLLQEHQQRRRNHRRQIFLLLTLDAWLRSKPN